MTVRLAQGCLTSLTLLFLLTTSYAQSQGSAFTYQGRLMDGGLPATGSYDLRLTLFDTATNGNQINMSVERDAVQVTSGIFSVTIDFGVAAFPGADRWLEIALRANGGNAFTIVTPRQLITAMPYAIQAIEASNAAALGGVQASQYVQTNDSRLSDPQPPAPGSPNYIQNSTTQQNAAFNITGNGIIGGMLTAGDITAGNSQGSGVIRAQKLGINLSALTPGEQLHIGDGNILLEGGGETALIIKEDFSTPGTPGGSQLESRKPIFKVGRIIKAGDGDPEFRVLYADDDTQEASVFELDRKGIVASVKPLDVGSHFEGFVTKDCPSQVISPDTCEPRFRLNSAPYMQLEMGPGGLNRTTDVAIRRPGDPQSAPALSFLVGNDVRTSSPSNEAMHIGADRTIGVGTSDPKAKLHVAAGNVYISDPGGGIILKSPNGTLCSLISLSDAGVLVPTMIACP